MAIRIVKTGVELDQATDAELRAWAKEEGRSKRLHAAILLRRLVALREKRPDALAELGLLTPKLGRN